MKALFILSALFTLTSCLQQPDIKPQEPMTEASASIDPATGERVAPPSGVAQKMTAANRICYGACGARQHFDYYTSDSDANPRPFVLLVHGGGWVFGPNATTYDNVFKMNSDVPYKNFVNNLVNNGFSIGIMKYRIPKYIKKTSAFTNVPFTQSPLYNMLDDINDALKEAISRAGELKIDTNRIGIIGESAGAHLALMYAYGLDYQYTHPSNQSKLKTVLSFYAPIDASKSDAFKNYITYPKPGQSIKKLAISPTSAMQWGDPTSSTQDEDTNAGTISILVKSAFDTATGTRYTTEDDPGRSNFCPISLANKFGGAALPSTLAMHGAGDQLVNPNQLDILTAAISAQAYTSALVSNKSVRHLTLKVGGYGHGWVSTSSPFFLSYQFDTYVSPKIMAWLNARLKN